MKNLALLLAEPIFQAIGWALIHFIWQGTVVAVLYACAQQMLRRSPANVRYLLGCAAMLMMLALPLANILLSSSPGPKPAPPAAFVAGAGALDSDPGVQTAAVETPASLPGSSAVQRSEAAPSAWQWASSERFATILPWLVSLWLLGVLALSIRVFGGWLMAQRLKRNVIDAMPLELRQAVIRLSRQLQISRPVRLCESVIADVPTVVGWFRPVILIPVSAVTGFSKEHLEALLAHELAHIRRYDYLVNLVQTAVETLLFYHPGVWWVSRQIRIEREHCCDDLAVAACGDVLTYARALTEFEESRAHAVPQLAVAANGGSLFSRIRRLVETPAPTSHRATTWVASLIVMAAVFCLWAGARNTLHASQADNLQSSSSDASGQDAKKAAKKDKSKSDKASTEPTIPASEMEHFTPTTPAQIDALQGVMFNVDRIAPRAPGGDLENGLPGFPPPAQRAAMDDQDERVPPAPPAAPYPPSMSLSSSLAPPAPPSGPVPPTPPQASAAYWIMAASSWGTPRVGSQDQDDKRLDYIDQLAELGYKGLSIDQLIKLRQSGVSASFIKSLNEAGYKSLPVERLIELRQRGVDGAYLKTLADAGYTKLDLDELIRLRDHGISATYIKNLDAAGFKHLPADQLVKLASHGVSSAYLKGLSDAGYDKLDMDEVVRLRDHGVGLTYIKNLDEAGFKHLTTDQLVKLATHGISSDYLKSIKQAGFGDLSFDQIIHLRDNGVTTEYLQAIKQAGYNDLTLDQAIRLRNHGIGATYIKELDAAGYKHLPLDQLIRLRDSGVSVEWLQSIKQEGYGDLPLDSLIRLRNNGVTAAFLKKVKAHGFNNLSIDDLLRLRNSGILN